MQKYFKHKLKNLLLVNKIVTVHYFEFDKDFTFGEESHDFWEIVYADKHNIFCTADGKKIFLKQGELLFHKPNVVHSLSSDGTNAPNVFIASFVCHSEAMRFFEDRKVKLNKNQIRYLYFILEEARRTFFIPFSDPETKKMILLESPTLGGEQLIKNGLELLLIDIMRTLTETESGNEIFLSENELDRRLVGEIIKILGDNVGGRLTVSDICRQTNYSKSYIFKKFKEVTGKSIMEFYSELKFKTAKELLRENELSVKEISARLSFDSPNYFTKSFKKVCGITPTAYRKKRILP